MSNIGWYEFKMTSAIDEDDAVMSHSTATRETEQSFIFKLQL